jgi:hypothetical protein
MIFFLLLMDSCLLSQIVGSEEIDNLDVSFFLLLMKSCLFFWVLSTELRNSLGNIYMRMREVAF